MEQTYIEIGDHCVLISSVSKVLMRWVKEYFPAKEQAHKEVDLTVNLADGYGMPFINYDVHISTNETSIIYQRADYELLVNPTYNHAIIAVYDELALRHALHNLYSAFIVHHKWGLMVHSSCVAHNGQAYIFSGQSGAGKSTAAKLSMPRPLLSDEATLIKISDSGIRVVNSPFRSEFMEAYQDVPLPLAGIYFLNQSLDIKAIPLKKSDALIGMIDKVFYWQHDEQETVKLLEMCKRLVVQTSIHNMYFQKNNRFWEVIV
ncbi:hypothetical protein MUG87_04135 [Ectobacillus sp. JY-23]|uniref:hypothetical protein n=1 Tax=Ectobacillus sp. JY-23 TaxID=2933872 RepID=UPI001FF2584C|nr:hypothetical protein [Ectobacillus sp. JY-23]UOY93323.1 hypothetical protein MUG87_04135 [Ectobacillus sp. JY-23]